MRWSFILISLLSLSLSSVLSTPIPGRGGGGHSSRSSSPAPSHSRSTSPGPAVHKSSPPPPAHNPSTHNSRSSSPAPPAHNTHPPTRPSSPSPAHDDKKKTPPPSRPASPGPGTHPVDKGKGKEPPPRRQQPSRKGKEKGIAKTSEIAKDEAPKPKKWTPKHSSKKYREAAKDAPWSVNPAAKDPKQWTLTAQKDGVKREPKKGEHADHVFEAQMLKKGLQKGGIDWHSLSKEHQNGIKDILNGKGNMQFIPGNVNMAKGRRVTSSLRPASSKHKQAADPNSKNSLRKKARQDAAQQKNPKKTKAPSADPESVTNYMKTSAPIAGHTAQRLDEYLTKNQIHSKPLMAPLLEDTYRKQGIIGATDSIPALPTKP